MRCQTIESVRTEHTSPSRPFPDTGLLDSLRTPPRHTIRQYRSLCGQLKSINAQLDALHYFSNINAANCEFGSSARHRFGVWFTEPLTLLALTGIPPEISPPNVRHRFGFGHRSDWPLEKPLRFFNSLTQWQRVRGPHNPLVEGSSPSRPTNRTEFMALDIEAGGCIVPWCVPWRTEWRRIPGALNMNNNAAANHQNNSAE